MNCGVCAPFSWCAHFIGDGESRTIASMSTAKILSSIDFLVARKFPGVPKNFFLPLPSVNTGSSGGTGSAWRKAKFEEAQRYRSELARLPPEDLSKRFEDEQAKLRAEQLEQIEREEQRRPFNQPHAAADLDYWSKMAHWTLDEAIALAFGKAPEYVNWKSVEPHPAQSPFAAQYSRVRELAQRALQWQQLYDPVIPGIFIAWAKRMQISFPSDLEAAVASRGHQIADWKSLHDALKERGESEYAKWKKTSDLQDAALKKLIGDRDGLVALVEKLTAEVTSLRGELDRAVATAKPASSRSGATRERESLLKLVIGMAVRGYKYQPGSSRSDATGDIANDLEHLGIALDADTIRKYLRDGAALLPPSDP